MVFLYSEQIRSPIRKYEMMPGRWKEFTSTKICECETYNWVEEFSMKLCPPQSRQELENDDSLINDTILSQLLIFEELEWALNKSKNTSLGKNSLRYSKLQQHPAIAKLLLSEIFYKIWTQENMSSFWKNVKAIHLRKTYGNCYCKQKNQKHCESYRSIILFSCIFKTIQN